MSGSSDPPPSSPFLPGHATVDTFRSATLTKVLLATKHSNSIPGEKTADWDYYDTFSGFRNVMTAQNGALKDMIRNVMEYNGMKARLGSTEVADLMDTLSDANDTILERINMNLDEAAGIKKDHDPLLLEVSQKFVAGGGGSWNNFNRQPSASSPVRLLAAKNVLRPQVKFSKLVDNSERPFQPRLTEKPHSMKPLSLLLENDSQGREVISHPYIYEMERDQPVASQLTITVPVKPSRIEDTSLVQVDTVEGLRAMVAELSQEEIIGVDVEHHNYRTYLGLTCLIQISTKTKDYLVDPFPLWSELPLLNEITANPRIVKVMHGCDSDVDWLQRDFSLYLRNVFDTHQAGKLLGLPRLSLAFLLSHYCSLEVDKKHQLADWRIRPLPADMIYYARQDTRYLIYLYTRLKNELISRGNAELNLLHAVLHQSNDIAKKRFYKPEVGPDSHMEMVRKARATLNNKQLHCLKELYSWRDKLARLEDESVMFVVPNHMVLKIATELPREMQGVLACCNPVPPLVKQHLVAIHNIVLSAREKQLLSVDPVLMERPSQPAPQGDSLALQHRLDLCHLEDAGDLKTVLSNKKTVAQPLRDQSNITKDIPDLSVFAKQREKKSSEAGVVEFISPYQRYVLLAPYLRSLETPETSDQPASEDVRLDSIKQHFDKLTEMTPTRASKKVEEAEEESDEGVLETSEEEVVEPKPKKPYFEESKEKVKKLRESGPQNKQRTNKKKSKRRKSERSEPLSEGPKEFDYNQVDFKQFGAKKPPQDGHHFSPKTSEKDNKKGGKKKQQFQKRGNKSFTFKKS